MCFERKSNRMSNGMLHVSSSVLLAYFFPPAYILAYSTFFTPLLFSPNPCLSLYTLLTLIFE